VIILTDGRDCALHKTSGRRAELIILKSFPPGRISAAVAVLFLSSGLWPAFDFRCPGLPKGIALVGSGCM